MAKIGVVVAIFLLAIIARGGFTCKPSKNDKSSTDLLVQRREFDSLDCSKSNSNRLCHLMVDVSRTIKG